MNTICRQIRTRQEGKSEIIVEHTAHLQLDDKRLSKTAGEINNFR